MSAVAKAMEDFRDMVRDLKRVVDEAAAEVDRRPVDVAEDAEDGELHLKLVGVAECAKALLDAMQEREENREPRQ